LQPGNSRSAGNLEARSAARSIALDRELTAAFCSRAHQAYNTDANDLLLAALCAGFSACSESSRLLIDVEGHGRDPFEGIDSSRTLGWFTSIYPVLFELESQADKGALIKRVKEQLRNIPNRGIGYGILRHIGTAAHPEGSLDFSQLPQAPMLFTYLGQLDQLAGRSGLYAGKVEPAPGIRSPRQNRTHALDVCAYVTHGCLQIQCTFESGTFSDGEIDSALANTLRELSALIEHCLDPAAGGMTPSDMPDLNIDQAQLDELLNEVALLDE
jgi:non-ribosomal peptide synthase protein (TIGR01720 family)